jgi:signal transduction histidine kinase/ActR/RegA family two-component response regulator
MRGYALHVSLAALLGTAAIGIFLACFSNDTHKQRAEMTSILATVDSCLDTLTHEALEARRGARVDHDQLTAASDLMLKSLAPITAKSWQHEHPQNRELHWLLRDLVVDATDLANKVEQLKTDAAIYRNSIRFMPAAVSRLGQNMHAEDDDDLRHAAHRVLGHLLAFSLEGDQPEPSVDMEADLDKIAAAATASRKDDAQQKEIQRLIAHARKANQYQRIVHRHTQEVCSHPIRKKVEQLYRHLHEKYAELDATAHTRKVWLIMLVGGISAYVAASFYQFYRIAHQLDQTNARLERRVLERTRDLERRTEQLDVARKLAVSATEAKSQFLANMSHEIRTPMTAILGYVEFLETEGDLDLAPQSRLRAIHTIRRNGEHLLAIINDILDISKVEAGKMQVESIPVDAVQICAEITSLMSVRAEGKGIRLETFYDSEISETIDTDPVRLRQIITNLLGNAIKFTEIGSVVLRVSMRETRDRNSLLVIEVQDTGIGMTEEQLGRVFDAFAQADTSTTRNFGGAGLGLRISAVLAKLLGGDLMVTSEVGVGSRFVLTINAGQCRNRPRIPIPEAHRRHCRSLQTVQAQPRPVVENPLAGLRILLAEDGPDNQRLIGFMVRKAGAQVTIVANGQEALQIAVANEETDMPFDLVLMDMQMPVMDGYSATRQLRAAGFSKPIVALTAHAMSGDRERCLHAGCTDYFTKPINRGRLIEMISQHCSQRVKAVTS